MNPAAGAGTYARVRLAYSSPASLRHLVSTSRSRRVSSHSSSARAPASADPVQATAESRHEEPRPLPLLPRPLGVSLQPSTTRTRWTENMWNQDTRMENRRVLSVVVVVFIEHMRLWLKQPSDNVELNKPLRGTFTTTIGLMVTRENHGLHHNL